MDQFKEVRFISLAAVLIVISSVVIATAMISSATQKRKDPIKFDEFGFVNRGDLQARLDNLAVQLQNDPGAQTYIKFHSGRRLPPEEVQATADYAKEYLVNSRGIDAARIVTVDAGPNRNSTVELWIVPAGATPP